MSGFFYDALTVFMVLISIFNKNEHLAVFYGLVAVIILIAGTVYKTHYLKLVGRSYVQTAIADKMKGEKKA